MMVTKWLLILTLFASFGLTPPAEEWKAFEDETYGFGFEYPARWTQVLRAPVERDMSPSEGELGELLETFPGVADMWMRGTTVFRGVDLLAEFNPLSGSYTILDVGVLEMPNAGHVIRTLHDMLEEGTLETVLAPVLEEMGFDGDVPLDLGDYAQTIQAGYVAASPVVIFTRDEVQNGVSCGVHTVLLPYDEVVLTLSLIRVNDTVTQKDIAVATRVAQSMWVTGRVHPWQ